MDPHVEKLTTPEECDQFILNVAEEYPALAMEARRKAVALRASQAGATTEAEREALEAVYAYEAVRTQPGGKKFRATRTWQMIKRHGIIKAIERAVDRDDDPTGYSALLAMNMKDLSFEAVVVRRPTTFSTAVVDRCKRRLSQHESA